MGANRFLKLRGAGIGFAQSAIFFSKLPQFIFKPPQILGGLDINWGLKNILPP